MAGELQHDVLVGVWTTKKKKKLDDEVLDLTMSFCKAKQNEQHVSL